MKYNKIFGSWKKESKFKTYVTFFGGFRQKMAGGMESPLFTFESSLSDVRLQMSKMVRESIKLYEHRAVELTSKEFILGFIKNFGIDNIFLTIVSTVMQKLFFSSLHSCH